MGKRHTFDVHPKSEGFRDFLFELSKLQCTVHRIASILGLAPITLKKWLDEDTELQAIRDDGLCEGQKNLQEAQMKCAIDDRNPQMLIWLGKQYLGQREPDKNVKLTADGETVEKVQAWVEMAKSARAIQEAKAGGVPRSELMSQATQPMVLVGEVKKDA